MTTQIKSNTYISALAPEETKAVMAVIKKIFITDYNLLPEEMGEALEMAENSHASDLNDFLSLEEIQAIVDGAKIQINKHQFVSTLSPEAQEKIKSALTVYFLESGYTEEETSEFVQDGVDSRVCDLPFEISLEEMGFEVL